MKKEVEPHFQSRSVRALVLMHEQALKEFLPLWRKAKYADIILPASESEHYCSLEHLLYHVLKSPQGYLTRSAQHLNLPPPALPTLPILETINDQAEEYIGSLLQTWRSTLVNVQDNDLEPEVYTPGMHYWIDAMLEHAAFHPRRHAFQLNELLETQT